MNQTCSIRAVHDESDIDKVAELAREIWTSHYAPIIGIEQVNYMLTHIQSRAAIGEDVARGKLDYHLIADGGGDQGYLAYRVEDGKLFLSKFYLLSSARGRGIGKAALAFVEQQARAQGASAIRLTVNRMNSGAIRAYERMGFSRTGDVRADIGGGFVMDDHVMERPC